MLIDFIRLGMVIDFYGCYMAQSMGIYRRMLGEWERLAGGLAFDDHEIYL